MSDPTPVLVPDGERTVERSDGRKVTHPVMTWHPEWREVLTSFAAGDPPATTIRLLDWYVTPDGTPPIEVFDWDSLPRDVAEGMLAMGESLWRVPVVPEGGFAHLTGMTQMLGAHTSAALTALGEAVVRASGGKPTTAMKIPIGANAGLPDGTFPVHVDDWPARNLLNVFTKPAPDHQGATLVLPVGEYEELALAAFGADQAAGMLSRIRRELPWDLLHYEQTFDWHENDEWDLIASTTRASIVVAYGEGEGYLVDDSMFLHGRTLVAQRDDRLDRIHRLTFDDERSYLLRAAMGGEYL
ncbi:MAG: hypothetical protein JWQ99_1240 [Blastococcus sp.]|jgi:hypothetical protein|nr:hypothetical protein [Blastococcus sp.]